MKKIWLIAWNTYRTRVRSGSFLFLTFALPVIMIVVGFIAVAGITTGEEQLAVGYVDQTGRLADVDRVVTEDLTLTLLALDGVEQARDAFHQGRIAGYLLIPGDYFEGGPVIFYAEESPGVDLNLAFEQFMRRALLPGVPEQTLERLEDPAEFTYLALQSGEEVSEGPGLVIRIIIPIVLAIVFGLAVVFTTGQMGAAVVREKEQRAMEMVITSLRPTELVSGKVLGMSLLALTQFGIWVLGGLIALGLAFSAGLELSDLSLPWGALLWGLLLIVPGYLLFAMIGAGLGIIAGDNQQAQQLAGLFGMFGFVPIWSIAVLINEPDGAAATFMTLFPLTAPSVSLLRMAFTEVPLWQLLASWVLLVLSLVLVTWAVARIFRAAMLVYGQALRPRQIWQALRQA